MALHLYYRPNLMRQYTNARKTKTNFLFTLSLFFRSLFIAPNLGHTFQRINRTYTLYNQTSNSLFYSRNCSSLLCNSQWTIHQIAVYFSMHNDFNIFHSFHFVRSDLHIFHIYSRFCASKQTNLCHTMCSQQIHIFIHHKNKGKNAKKEKR